MEEVNQYDLEFKHKICRLYSSGNYSIGQLQREFGIGGNSTITKWMHKFGYTQSNGYFVSKSKHQTEQQAEDSELALLREKLRDAELKAEAYERLIRNAEKEHKIDIVKKENTK